MSMHRPSGCPSCAEPLEEGDRFCGVCGYAVSAPPPPAGERQAFPVAPLPAAAPAGTFPASASGPTAPTGAHPGGAYGFAEPAPGWGAVAGAAQGPAGDPAGWVTAPAQPPAGGVPWSPGEGPVATRYDLPGAPYGDPDPDPGPAREAPYGTPAPDHVDPYAAAARGGGEDPYGAPAAGEGGGGKTCVACRAGRVDTDGYCEHCGHAQPRERDHLEEELGSVAAVSDRGLRHHRNEDAFAVAATALPGGLAATVAVVCDGVSSASRPDEASAAAAGAANESLLDALPRGAHPQEAMHEAILAAAAAVNALAPQSPGAQNAPACTLVGAVVSGGLLTIGWVGDSRAYWIPDDRAALPRRLTEDDSWAAQMVAAGLMGEAEAYADVRAHAITGWLGADAYDLDPHTATFEPDHPGVIVVCTDGLWNYAESAREMAAVLPADAAARPLHSAQVLVGHALDGGGHDNITVAVVPFAGPPLPPVSPPPAGRTEPGPRQGTAQEAEPGTVPGTSRETAREPGPGPQAHVRPRV
ncbi:protein phosphatase 2C domain-containing protein [Streptomyces sp. NPDC051567]|uniref:protein phosphatase 2C domain-containing protein n=1 Tax=Streptomyces sp. NPDC051567 TaxID=3365660 RepID=UPI0037B6A273